MGPQDGPEMSTDGPKMASKEAQAGTQDGSKRLQEDYKLAQNGARRSKWRPNGVPNGTFDVYKSVKIL